MLAMSLASWMLWTFAIIIWIGARLLACPRCGSQGTQFHRVLHLQLVLFPAALIVAYVESDRRVTPVTV